MRKASAAKGYRRRARREAEQQQVVSGPWPKATVQAAFFHKQKRRRDDVNHLAMLKPAYDGLVDAGLLDEIDFFQNRKILIQLCFLRLEPLVIHDAVVNMLV